MDLTKEMAAEVEDLIGPGYVPDYYRSLAAGFVGVAEDYAESALAARLAAVEALAEAAGCADPVFGQTCLEAEDTPRYWCLSCAIRAALATGATTNQEADQ